VSDNRGVADDARRRATRMTVAKYADAAEADRHDLEFWRRMSDADRVLHVWRLSQELWRLSGAPPHEPGLCRSVARVYRR
jgi:hypothetical protein